MYKIMHTFRVNPIRFAGILALALLISSLAHPAYAKALSGKDMVGGRVGVWVNNGDRGITTDPTIGELSGSSPYAELFYNHGFSNWFRGEVALGISKRSELVSDQLNVVGGVNLYPLQFSLKFYPLGPLSISNLHPFVQSGFGFSIANQSIRRLGSFRGGSNTQTDLDIMFGGGFDIPVAEKIGITVAGKYHRIDFGNAQFLGASDFSGYSFSAGIVYLFPFGDR